MKTDDDPVTALLMDAGKTLNIAYSSITITPSGYRQGEAAETAYTGDYVITGTSTANTITVTGGTEKAMNVTLQGMTTVGINVSEKVNLIISGENKVNGSILFNDGALGISGNGTLTCIAGGYNVAIGSANSTNLTGSITIGGNVTVNATAAKGAAAIGSGYSAGMAESSSITIKDNAVVNAYAIDDSTAGSGAAIGVGRTGRGLAAEMNGTITIQDNASVTATGSGRGGGAAIGAAVNFNAGSKISKLGGTINILGGVVKATGGGAAAAAGNAAAPAIGVGAGGVMTGTVNISGGIVELIPGNGCKYAIGTPAGEAGTMNRSGGILKEGGGDWTLLSDNETLRTNWMPANGQMLIINVGQTFTIAKGVTLTIPEGFTVENNGVVMVIGSLIGEVGGDVRYAVLYDSIDKNKYQIKPRGENESAHWVRKGAMFRFMVITVEPYIIGDKTEVQCSNGTVEKENGAVYYCTPDGTGGITIIVTNLKKKSTPHGLEAIVAAHLAVTDAVRHGSMMKADRYFVWQEDGANDLTADGVHAEKAITGTTDLFTKRELDPWREELEAAFDASPYIVWTLNSVQYEESTGFWHYEWVWEVF